MQLGDANACQPFIPMPLEDMMSRDVTLLHRLPGCGCANAWWQLCKFKGSQKVKKLFLFPARKPHKCTTIKSYYAMLFRLFTHLGRLDVSN